MANKVTFSWGEGTTDLFFRIKDGKPEIFDAEFDGEYLHQNYGGKTYYTSRSGASGAGYLDAVGDLIRIGTYRVDTKLNDWQIFQSVGEVCINDRMTNVWVAVPYISHSRVDETLERNPTVIKVGEKVIFCNFFKNFLKILKIVLLGGDLDESLRAAGQQPKTMTKTFTGPDDWGGFCEKEISLEFWDFFDWETHFYPWEFLRVELEPFLIGNGQERIHQLLCVEKLDDGSFVRVVSIGGVKYRGAAITGDPIETGELTAGWKRIEDDVLVRYYEQEVHLISYMTVDQGYRKYLEKLSRHLKMDETFVSSVIDGAKYKYEEFELMTPKALFFLDEPGQIAQVRQFLSEKIRQKFYHQLRQWVSGVSDHEILEEIPDDMVVTIQDSLDAGNCLPGTESFAREFFPGRTKITAGELKKYSNNPNVMRVFLHLTLKE